MSKKASPANETESDPLSVGHHLGDRIWGYEVFKDGSIQLSPSFSDRLVGVIDEEAGLLVMQRNIAEYVSQRLKIVSHERREWWRTLYEELGINEGETWSFDPRSRRIKKTPNDDEQAA